MGDHLSGAWRAGGRARRFRFRCCALAISLLLLLAGGGAQAADPDALWKLVHDRCVPDQLQHGDPSPCARVDLSAGEDNGYILLKDLVGATQFLLIPTARITGIESPAILAPGAANYFAAAWRGRSLVEQQAGRKLPRDWLSLAINSEIGRSQNQLHIHIDCVRTDVREALSRHGGEIGTGWAPFPEPLAGHAYDAIAVSGDALDAINPFFVLADGIADARRDMGRRTLVVVGAIMADGEPGFIILADHADAAAGDPASGEELQDHGCALLRQ